LATAFSDVRLGIGYNTLANYHYDGEIDGFRMWSVNRSAADIMNLYQKGIFDPPPGLTGLWEFNEPAGDTVYSFNSGIKGVLFNTNRVSSGALIHDPGIDAGTLCGMLAAGDTTSVDVTFSTSGFNSGTHNSMIAISTNDPLNQFVVVPTKLILNGSPQIILNDTFAVFPPVMTGVMVTDTFQIYNSGCDTLKITAVNHVDAVFTVVYPSFVPAGDSGLITVSFYTLIQGTYNDTLTILNNSEIKQLYVSASAVITPKMEITPDSIFASTNICHDTITSLLKVKNTGNDTLRWSAYCTMGAGSTLSFNGSSSEVHFGNLGQMPDNGCIEFWMKSNVTEIRKNVFSSSGLNNNYKGINICQFYNELFLFIGDDNGSYSSFNITYDIDCGHWHHVAVTWDKTQNKVWAYFDGNVRVNGSSNSYWPTAFSDVRLGIAYNNTPSYHFNGQIDELRIWGEYHSGTEIKTLYQEPFVSDLPALIGLWEFNEPGGDTVYSFNNHKNGVLYNVSRAPSGADIRKIGIVAIPDVGTVAAGDSADIQITINTAGLPNGDHYGGIGITSNDPLFPVAVVPVHLVLSGNPELQVLTSVLSLDTIVAGTSVSATVPFVNKGCDTLYVTDITQTNAAFTLNPSSLMVLTGDTAELLITFTPADSGNFPDTIQFITNGGNQLLFVLGVATIPPSASVTITSLPYNSCQDSVLTCMALPANGGSNPLYQWYVNDALMQEEYGINYGDIFSYTPLDTDSITCIMTSNLPNVIHNPDTSNVITITVSPPVLPDPAGTISGLSGMCQGHYLVTYTIPVINNAVSYIWTLPYGTTGSSSTNSITVNFSDSAVSGNVRVKGHNYCGDGSESLLSVTVHPLPVVHAGSDTIINQGASFTLHGSINGGTAPYSVLWVPPDNLSQNNITCPLASPVNSSTYILTVTDANNCFSCDSVNVVVKYVITGNVIYNNSFQTPMKNEWVFLENVAHVVVDSVLTSGTGNYYFGGVGGGTHYLYAKPSYLHGGINATDALMIRRHIVHLASLNGINVNAADVNNTHAVSSADALQVLRRTVGVISTFDAGDWTSEIKNINFISNVQNEVIKVLCMGDVNGSYNIYNLKSANGAPELACIQEETNFIAGEIVDLPVRVNQNILPGAITLYLQFPDDLLDIYNVTVSGNPVEYRISNGVLSVGAYDVKGMVLHNNTLLSLRCKIKPGVARDNVCISLLNNSEIADIEGNVLNALQLNVSRLNILDYYDGYKMENNVPNPFYEKTTIRIYLPEETAVDLSVLNLQGIELKMASYDKLGAGWHELQIDAEDLDQGVYFYCLHAVSKTSTFRQTRSMMIIR